MRMRAYDGRVAELVDAQDSKSCGSNPMRVRFPPCPPFARIACGKFRSTMERNFVIMRSLEGRNQNQKMETFIEVSVILGIATLIAWIMQLLRQPLILGHIITGIIAGPLLFNVVKSSDLLDIFSKIGITALLFIVGLSLNPRMIREVGKVSVYAGVGQVVFTVLFGFLITYGFGFDWVSSLYIAIALTFSSTIIVMKLLSDRGDLGKLYGKISVGFLLVQDLIATAILIGIATVGKGTNAGTEIAWTLGKGVVIIAILYVVARYILPALTKSFAQSQEFLLLFSIAWGMGLAALFQWFGFSIEIGALAAGVTLASSSYHYEISAKMKLLRDFFIVIFFILLGARLSFVNISHLWLPMIVLSLFVLIGNPLILLFILGRLGYTRRTAFMAGLTVAQISEFSLVLILLAGELGQVGPDVVALVTFVGLITISVSSYMLIGADKLYEPLKDALGIFERKKTHPERSRKEVFDIVLFGCHRLGQDFLPYLKKSKKRYLVIDFDPSVIEALEKKGYSCRYGDAEDNEFIDDFDLKKLKLVVSTLPDEEANEFLLHKIKKANAKCVVVVTAQSVEQALYLYSIDADYVIMPHYLGGNYASLLISKHGLRSTHFKRERVKHLKHLQERHLPLDLEKQPYKGVL